MTRSIECPLHSNSPGSAAWCPPSSLSTGSRSAASPPPLSVPPPWPPPLPAPPSPPASSSSSSWPSPPSSPSSSSSSSSSCSDWLSSPNRHLAADTRSSTARCETCRRPGNLLLRFSIYVLTVYILYINDMGIHNKFWSNMLNCFDQSLPPCNKISPLARTAGQQSGKSHFKTLNKTYSYS